MAASPELKRLADQIDLILTHAKVAPPNQAAARKRLVSLLKDRPFGKSPARSVYDAGVQRGSPAPHNKKLEAILVAVKKLERALIELRELPYTHETFWSFNGIKPKRSNESERTELFYMLEDIQNAVAETKIDTTAPSSGGKRQTKRIQAEKYNLAEIAVQFYHRFSEDRLLLSSGNQDLVSVVQIFFEAVTGSDCETFEFRSQIDRAARRFRDSE